MISNLINIVGILASCGALLYLMFAIHKELKLMEKREELYKSNLEGEDYEGSRSNY